MFTLIAFYIEGKYRNEGDLMPTTVAAYCLILDVWVMVLLTKLVFN